MARLMTNTSNGPELSISAWESWGSVNTRVSEMTCAPWSAKVAHSAGPMKASACVTKIRLSVKCCMVWPVVCAVSV